jgi:hypothetical protein
MASNAHASGHSLPLARYFVQSGRVSVGRLPHFEQRSRSRSVATAAIARHCEAGINGCNGCKSYGRAGEGEGKNGNREKLAHGKLQLGGQSQLLLSHATAGVGFSILTKATPPERARPTMTRAKILRMGFGS